MKRKYLLLFLFVAIFIISFSLQVTPVRAVDCSGWTWGPCSVSGACGQTGTMEKSCTNWDPYQGCPVIDDYGNYCGGSTSCGTVDCVAATPRDGQCGSTHYNCDAGSSINNVNATNSWDWTCTGTDGGFNNGCREYKIYNVSCSAASGCSCSPATQQVFSGNTASVSFSASTNYSVGAISGCTGAVTSNCSITAACNYTPPIVNCAGYWSICSGGSQTFTVTTPASGGGTACPYSPQSCGTAASWSGYSACSGGSQSGTCTQATGGGAPTCAGLGYSAGTNTRSCGTPAVWYGWSACSGGSQSGTCTQASGGGAPTCAGIAPGYTAGTNTRSCGTNCIGSWGACSNGSKTYTISQNASGGGAVCPYSSGTTTTCGTACVGSWGACSNGSKTYTISQNASGGGAVCPYSSGTTSTCGTPCIGSWSACSNGSTTYTYSQNASGGGAVCQYSNGATSTCGTPGTWGGWNPVAVCPTACGNSASTLTRYCNSPAPTGGGTNCVGSSTQSCAATEACVIYLPDLAAGSVTPTTAVSGVNTSYTATISNDGNITSGTSFNNLFQFDDDVDHNSINDTVVVSAGPVVQQGTANISASHSFATGTRYVRVCADSNAARVGSITESNEDNNCGNWTNITVSAAPTPNLTAGLMSPTTATINTSQTFSATITNGGNLTTGTSFNNFFQFDDTGDNVMDTYAIVSAGPIGASGTANVSATHTFPSSGNRFMRVCADNNASWVGTINEGTVANENDNCGSWASVLVSGVVVDGVWSDYSPTADCPTSCGYAGGQIERTCTPPQNGGQTCAGSNIKNCPATAQCAMANLTANSITPTTATTNVDTTFSSEIWNSGRASTGNSFNVLFQTATDPNNPATILDVPESVSSGQPLYFGFGLTVSKTFKFTSPATYHMRVCADKSSAGDPGVIYEGTSISAEENDNCGAWTDIEVTDAINGLCASVHGTCSKGTSGPVVNNASGWTWKCNGVNGGTQSSCSESKKKPTFKEN